MHLSRPLGIDIRFLLTEQNRSAALVDMPVEPAQEYSPDALQRECVEYLCARLGEARSRSWFQTVRFELADNADRLNVAVGKTFRREYIIQNFTFDLQALAKHLLGADADFEITGEISDYPQSETMPVQSDMFDGLASELAVKDDVHLMGIAPFTLQPRGENRTRLVE